MVDHVLAPPPVLVAAPVAVPVVELPAIFAVSVSHLQRDGYALYSWENGGVDHQHKPIHVLRAQDHGDLFYDIRTIARTLEPHQIASKKRQGTTIYYPTWRHTTKFLVRGHRNYPILRITPALCLPTPRATSFIPIVNQPPVANEVAQVAPVLAPGPKIYTIATIPQHAVRAFLRDAAMQEETCSITGEEIDIVNGAMTSCFHLFEKNAIATWLAMPASQDKCPVCNCKCNSFTVE